MLEGFIRRGSPIFCSNAEVRLGFEGVKLMIGLCSSFEGGGGCLDVDLCEFPDKVFLAVG